MIPDCDLAKVAAAGNAAGTAPASRCSIRRARGDRALVEQVEKIETAVEPRFQAHFVGAMAIPHKTAPIPTSPRRWRCRRRKRPHQAEMTAVGAGGGGGWSSLLGASAPAWHSGRMSIDILTCKQRSGLRCLWRAGPRVCRLVPPRFAHEAWMIELAFSHQSLDSEWKAWRRATVHPAAGPSWRDAMARLSVAAPIAGGRMSSRNEAFVRAGPVPRVGIGPQAERGAHHRRKGEGFKLMRLDTAAQMSEAVGLYEAIGFKRCAPTTSIRAPDAAYGVHGTGFVM